MDLLELADRLGFSDLKLFVESKMVEHGFADVDAAIRMLFFADGHSCALLKEAALDLLVAKPNQAMQSSEWETLKESGRLCAEVFEHSFGGKATSVAELRHKLKRRGEKDVDGSKETLRKRLRRIEEEGLPPSRPRVRFVADTQYNP